MPIPLGIFATAGAGGSGGSAFELISTQVLTSSASSVTFSSIPQTYKHLQIRILARGTSGTFAELHLNLNSDTGANYANHQLRATGSVVNSESQTSQSRIRIGNAAQTATAEAFYAVVLDALDYSSASKNTTIRALTGYTANGYDDARLISGAWFNTSAVTSMAIVAGGTNLATGSRFSLYGIKG